VSPPPGSGLGAAEDAEEVVVGEEIEAGEGHPFGLQVVRQPALALVQLPEEVPQVRQPDPAGVGGSTDKQILCKFKNIFLKFSMEYIKLNRLKSRNLCIVLRLLLLSYS